MTKSVTRLFYPFLIVSFLFLYGCKEDAVDHSFIRDKWIVTEAYRNEVLTTTLEDGFFHLTSDTTFTTNIFGAEQELTMSINEEGWVQEGNESTQYYIDVIADDTIDVKAELRGFDFKFLMVRDTTSESR